MTEREIDALNEQFAVPGHLTFTPGPGGMLLATIRNAHAAATAALYGGQALSFAPHGRAGVLWTSSEAVYTPGKAIRGGIPVCWPWFGPHPGDPARPAHGFARTRPWRVLETAAAPGGATALRLGLSDDEATRALWPHSFDLQIHMLVGRQLRVELTVCNTGDAPFVYTGALHSYFAVGDITQVQVQGLDDRLYLDQLTGERSRQQGAVTFGGETDRVYFDAEETCVIEDPSLGRRIIVGSRHSRSTVVWNPWAEKARRLADFGDDEYRAMVCVETANAADDRVEVAPGGEGRLTAEIAVEDL